MFEMIFMGISSLLSSTNEEDDRVMPYMTLKPLFPTSSYTYIDNSDGGKYYYDDKKLRDGNQKKRMRL